MITKKRTAQKREYNCAETNAVIKIGDSYYDSDEPLNPPKPFPTKKFSLEIGEKKLNEQTANQEKSDKDVK